MKFIDLTHTLSAETTVFPGDLPVQLRKDKALETDGYNNYQLCSGMHIGTHLDGPMHLTNNTSYISDLSLHRFSGEGLLFGVQGIDHIGLKQIDVSLITPGKIVLFYSGMDKKFGTSEYFEQYPILERDLVDFLAGSKIKMIGLDWCSPDRDPYPMHKILLGNDILIAENLKNLELLFNCNFEFFAFPLKIAADSSLIRAVARIVDERDYPFNL